MGEGGDMEKAEGNHLAHKDGETVRARTRHSRQQPPECSRGRGVSNGREGHMGEGRRGSGGRPPWKCKVAVNLSRRGEARGPATGASTGGSSKSPGTPGS